MKTATSVWARFAALALFLSSVSALQAQTTLRWNFNDDNATFDSGTPTNFTVSDFSIGNANAALADPVNPTSPSSGYAGASGSGNMAHVARLGSLNITTSSFYEVTLTPTAGYFVRVTDFDFAARSTATGAVQFSLFSSDDNFASALFSQAHTNDSTWRSYDTTLVARESAVGTPLVLRLFLSGGTGANPTTANTRLDDISIVATAVIPEPQTAAMLLGVGAGLAGWILRKRRRG